MERDFNKILATEYSKRFDTLKNNLLPEKYQGSFDEIRKKMMVMSYFKYSPMKDNYNEYKCMDAVGNLKKRLEKYKLTGNTEFLADVANFAMIEFMYPSVPGATVHSVKVIDLPEEDEFFSWFNVYLESYQKNADLSCLACIAAIANIEFEEPTLENAHYQPTDAGACDIVGFSINEIRDFDR